MPLTPGARLGVYEVHDQLGHRLADIADARLDLDESPKAADSDESSAVARAAPAPVTSSLVWIAALLVLAVISAAYLMWRAGPEVAPIAPLRLTADLGADISIQNSRAAIALSSDGTQLAFVAPTVAGGLSQLYVRALGQLQATALSGTTGARNPLFSPDGQWVGFFADGKLKKAAVRGGGAITLCDAPEDRGGAWADDGSIFFQSPPSGSPLFLVSSAGGEPRPVTTLVDNEVTHRWPQVLPGGRAVLYTSHTAQGNFDSANIVVQPLPDGDRKILQRGGYFGRFVASGHLLYVRQGTLFAVPFDLNRLEVAGQAVPVLEGFAAGPTGVGANGAAQLAVSSTGTLVYVPGGSFEGTPIHWVDGSGKTMPLRATPAFWRTLRFSPDGHRLALELADSDGPQTDVWVYEWARDLLTRVTFDPAEDLRPIWTPDGRRIAFGSRRERRTSNLFWQRADGTGNAQRLTDSGNPQLPDSWHPNGKILAFTEAHAQTGLDLMTLSIDGDEASGWTPGKPEAWLRTPFAEQSASFSPDGRWLAYASNETGRSEIYVRPFPGPGGKWLVSSSGGAIPRWSRTRNELFYQATDQRIMVASYTATGSSFVVDKVRLWSEQRFVPRSPSVGVSPSFDLHPDGERIALAPAQESNAQKQNRMVVVVNFFDELRRLAPAVKH